MRERKGERGREKEGERKTKDCVTNRDRLKK